MKKKTLSSIMASIFYCCPVSFSMEKNESNTVQKALAENEKTEEILEAKEDAKPIKNTENFQNIKNKQQMINNLKGKISEALWAPSRTISEKYISQRYDEYMYNKMVYCSPLYSKALSELLKIGDDISLLQKAQIKWEKIKELKLETADLIDDFYQIFQKEYEDYINNQKIKNIDRSHILDIACHNNGIKTIDCISHFFWHNTTDDIAKLRYNAFFELCNEIVPEKLQEIKSDWEEKIAAKKLKKTNNINERKNNNMDNNKNKGK